MIRFNSILRFILGIGVILSLFLQIRLKKKDSSLSALINHSPVRSLSHSSGVLENFGLFAEGICLSGTRDAYGHFPFVWYFPGTVQTREECAARCDPYPGCIGFSFGTLYGPSFADCYVHFNGFLNIADPTSYPSPAGGWVMWMFRGSGPVGGYYCANHMGCFEKGGIITGNLNAIENYENLGEGYCVDIDGERFDFLSLALGPLGNTEFCAEKCDTYSESVGFNWDLNHYRCKCLFNHEDIPWDPNVGFMSLPRDAALDSTNINSGKGCVGRVEPNKHLEQSTCFRRRDAPRCATASPVPAPTTSNPVPAPITANAVPARTVSIIAARTVDARGADAQVSEARIDAETPEGEVTLSAAVNGDPLFTGLKGQVFKFDGRHGAWYSNVAAKNLQWNIRFGQYDNCPKKENMFMTGTSLNLYRKNWYSKMEITHSIVIKIVDPGQSFPECESNVCIGNGSLILSVDGTVITKPGDYSLQNIGGRIIAHNTFAACSKKWYDFKKSFNNEGITDPKRQLSFSKTPIEYLLNDRAEMLHPLDCQEWVDNRISHDDLFEQGGNWATIHIETPLVSFHIEYRQNSGEQQGCDFKSIDAWISKASHELLREKWQGILGETREPKYYADGRQIIGDRGMLLAGKNDSDYEVDGEHGIEFATKI